MFKIVKEPGFEPQVKLPFELPDNASDPIVCLNKGCHINFSTGVVLSIQWGTFNYCSVKRNWDDPLEFDVETRTLVRTGEWSSPDAEIAMWFDDNSRRWITRKFFEYAHIEHDDDVLGYCSPKLVEKAVWWCSRD